MNKLGKYSEVTKMGNSNLALVITPNLLRSTSTDPMQMLQNGNAERKFVEILINTSDRLKQYLTDEDLTEGALA